LDRLSPAEVAKIAAIVIEPLIQGAAGMQLWSSGTLRAVREWCDRTDTLLIADEVMTGFGRTGRMFGIEHESVIPDIVVLGKGLSGGYLPLAYPVSEKLSRFQAELLSMERSAYGHSYTGNALVAAQPGASLDVFEKEASWKRYSQIRHPTSVAGLADIPAWLKCGGLLRDKWQIVRSPVGRSSCRDLYRSPEARTSHETDSERHCVDAAIVHHH
jgi:adenosylmethionine-8-amino-7-oxononanoate aminotransferase